MGAQLPIALDGRSCIELILAKQLAFIDNPYI
jgi:hypothetical protein